MWSGVSSPSIVSELDPTSQLCAKLSFSALGIPNLCLKTNVLFSQIRRRMAGIAGGVSVSFGQVGQVGQLKTFPKNVKIFFFFFFLKFS